MMQITIASSTEPLKLWERIEIVVGDGPSAGHYFSRFEDFTGYGIVISSPEFIRGDTLLRDRCECEVILTRDDAIYTFSTQIRMIKRPPRRIYLLDAPRDARRVQRRQFVRVERWEPVRLLRIGVIEDEGPEVTELEWIEAVSVDLSGGGMLVKTAGSVGIRPADPLAIHVPEFARLGFVPTLAAVCRRVFTEQNDYYHGLEFIRDDQLYQLFSASVRHSLPAECRQFDLAMQNKLVNFVFGLQLDLRRKGLL